MYETELSDFYQSPEILYQCTECGWYSADHGEVEEHSDDTDHVVLDFELGPEDILEREDFQDR
jgi:hypothetical protein